MINSFTGIKKFSMLLSLVIIILSQLNVYAQAPVITTQPSSQGVIEGQTATFFIEASGDGLSYQWYKDGIVIGGATDSAYTTPATVLGDNGSEFSVAVTNISGSDSSNAAILYVTESGSRVTAGQIVLYDFDGGNGTTINDVSGVGTPLNLTINKPQAVSWSPVSLLVKDTALINSSVATKIINAATSSNEITIELWVKPLLIKTVTDRIFELTQSSPQVNFGVEALPSNDGYNFVVRTTNTDSYGIPGTVDTEGLNTELAHLVFTSKDGISKIYRNGIETNSRVIGGNFSTWNTQARLSLGSFLGGSRPWKGIFYLAAVYNRALDSTEAAHNFSIGTTIEEAPFIIEEPQNLIVLEGLSATFKVKTIGNTPISYQWQKDGVDIPGATDTFYITPPTTLDDSGSVYTVIATNSNGSDTSLSAVLEITSGGLNGCIPGMTQYYKLEESSSPYINSYGFTDAVSTNPPVSETGIVGNAQNFSNQETINIPDDNLSDWNPDDSFSIEFWMKTDFVPSSVNVAIGRDDNSTDLHWWVGYNPNGTVSFQLRSINNEGILIGNSGPAVNDDNWHLITAVRNGTANKNYLYVDGIAIDSATQVYNASFEGITNINIGYLNISPFYYFNGSLDEIAIFNAALSQSEIQMHYNNGLAGFGYCGEEIAAPQSLTAEPLFARVELAWEDLSDNEDGFIIERALQDSSFSVIDSVAANDTSYTDMNIADTTTYEYRVKAYNLITESDYSNEVSVTTLLSSLAAPGNLIAELNPQDTTNVDLTWDDNSSNETGFVIQRALGSSPDSSDFNNIDTVAADVTSYTDTTTSDTTTYTYRIYAFNDDTVSAFSNLADITTAIPVELTSFNANVVNGKVLIEWETATETNNAGFGVERSQDNLKFEELVFIEGKGTTTNTSHYTYNDNSALAGTYFYRLRQTDFDGSVHYSNSIEIDLGIPKEFALYQNYPNPFNPSTTIRFALPMNAKVDIKLYNTLGQEVLNIFNNSELDAGNHEIFFNGSSLSSGVYFYRLEAKGIDGSIFTETKRMILIK